MNSDRVAIVTGGTKGIGLAVAREIAATHDVLLDPDRRSHPQGGPVSKVGLCMNGQEYETATTRGALNCLNRLQRLDGVDFYAFSLWHYPDDVDFYDVKKKAIRTYLQCAGSAERMTIEVRREENGEDVQYTLGREPQTGDEDQQVPWDGHVVTVYPSEVFTAAEAEPIFEHYYETGTVPPGLHLRQLDL